MTTPPEHLRRQLIDALDQARIDHDNAHATADQHRARVILHALESGMPQKDIAEIMGYSRETIRRITRAARKENT